MGKQFAVLHCEKGGKGNAGGLGYHIDRIKGYEHMFDNADPERTHLNKEYCKKEFAKITLQQAINKRIDEGYKAKRLIRSDAVKFLENLFTGSHEQMMKIFADEHLKNEWIKANYIFACKEFGEDNIVRFTLHLDEKTPHIHCVTVPLTRDGRLSAREVYGNSTAYRKRQDRYAEAMKPFGLERGKSNKITGAKHIPAKEYNKLVAQEVKEVDFKPVKTFGFINGKKTVEKAKNSLKNAQLEVAETKAETKAKLKQTQRQNEYFLNALKEHKWEEITEENKRLRDEFLEMSEKHTKTLQDALKYLKEIEKLRKEIEEEREQGKELGKMYDELCEVVEKLKSKERSFLKQWGEDKEELRLAKKEIEKLNNNDHFADRYLKAKEDLEYAKNDIRRLVFKNSEDLKQRLIRKYGLDRNENDNRNENQYRRGI